MSHPIYFVSLGPGDAELITGGFYQFHFLFLA